jgi:hypothetical protein
MMRPGTYEHVGKSESVLIMIHPITSPPPPPHCQGKSMRHVCKSQSQRNKSGQSQSPRKWPTHRPCQDIRAAASHHRTARLRDAMPAPGGEKHHVAGTRPPLPPAAAARQAGLIHSTVVRDTGGSGGRSWEGPGKYEHVGKSRSVLIMINPMISPRTRSVPPPRRVSTALGASRLGNTVRRTWQLRR